MVKWYIIKNYIQPGYTDTRQCHTNLKENKERLVYE